jgi:phage baseplate assembly protein V
MSSEETVYDLRQVVRLAVVKTVDDGTALQQVDVQPHDSDIRTGVEVMLPWGLVSVPPAGAITVLLAVGGDPAHVVALPPTHPGARPGKAPAGTIGLADAGGNRVLIKPGGVIEVVAATTVQLVVQGNTLTIDENGMRMNGMLSVDPNGVHITGTLTVDGPIHGTADMADAAHRLG